VHIATAMLYHCVSDVSDGADKSGNATAVKKTHFMPKKRPPPSDAELHQRKIKRMRDRLQLGSPVASNAVMVLNEYDKSLMYELVEQSGPVHNPSFTIQIIVNGQVSAVRYSSVQYCLFFQAVLVKFAFFSVILRVIYS